MGDYDLRKNALHEGLFASTYHVEVAAVPQECDGGSVGRSPAPRGIQPGAIRSNVGTEGSIGSQAWPRMAYVSACGLNWLGSSRLAACTEIRSGMAANVRKTGVPHVGQKAWILSLPLSPATLHRDA